jgi:signal transduction histidine kinase
MAVSDWLRPPRHLVVLFLGIALILMVTLAWLGWRLFQQDRALEKQRVQVRLEHAADVVAGELSRQLDAIRDDLTRLSTVPGSAIPDSAERLASRFSNDAVVIVLRSDGVAAYPSGRLVYYPTTRPVPQSGASVFARGEAFEFRRRDLPAAARTYGRLAESADSAVRAGALMRLARTERKVGRLTAALGAYDQLRTLGSTAVGDLPAELVARHARLPVLEALDRPDALRLEAEALRSDLCAGRWHLTRSQYEFYKDDACRWMDCEQLADSAAMAAGEALAAGADWLWNRRGTVAEGGREMVWLDGQPVLVVWQGSSTGMAALVGGATHLADDWIGGLEQLRQGQNVRVAFADVSGTALTEPLPSTQELVVRRTVAETGLPWTLQVASADPLADFAQLRERRTLMLLGLATLALFVMVGLYGVMRGVSRELDVARLQSDFVAAVSHEFRTPLTSLKQLAELLASGRVASEERRARYYGIMERESGRLHRLVEGLLDFGRMEAGAMEFNWERVAPSELVRSVVTEFEAERVESGCQVELSVDGATSSIRADSEALTRAVWNLLDNATKYSPDGQTVGVSVSQRGGRVAIAVRDEGVGIAPAQQRDIFKKFVRGTSADGRGAKGTGIGLAMVKHIVEAHGGVIQVESEVGRGSTFTILLPAEG